MCKKLVIAVVAMIGLVAIWQTDAEAQCLSWRTIGGSSMCVAWATKGVQVQVEFKQDCGPDGAGCGAFVRADATDSVVFCQNPTTNQITTRRCPPPTGEQHFTGFINGCEPKHEKDFDDDPGGQGHDKGKHGCKASTVLQPIGPAACGACADECTSHGEACLDLTPIEMTTSVSAFSAGGIVGFTPSEGQDLVKVQQPADSDCGFVSKGPACFFEEQCAINVNRIRFIPFDPESTSPPPPGQKYQCEVTCAGTECFGD